MGKLKFLFIGIISCFIFFNSCDKGQVDYIIKGDYNYINKQKDTVYVCMRGCNGCQEVSYTIYPNDTLKLDMEANGPKGGGDPETYPSGLQADSVVIRMYDSLCYGEFDRKYGKVINNQEWYRHEKITNNHYRFYFDIDSTILPLASKCK